MIAGAEAFGERRVISLESSEITISSNLQEAPRHDGRESPDKLVYRVTGSEPSRCTSRSTHCRDLLIVIVIPPAFLVCYP